MNLQLNNGYSLSPIDIDKNELDYVETTQLTIETGLEALSQGDIIFAKGYDWAKNDDIYFRLNPDTGLTEIAYSINSINSKLNYFRSYNVPINIFKQTECFVYLPIQASLKYNVGDTVKYMSMDTQTTDTQASIGCWDSAIVLGVYHQGNTIYYELSREPHIFEDISTASDAENSKNIEENPLLWQLKKI